MLFDNFKVILIKTNFSLEKKMKKFFFCFELKKKKIIVLIKFEKYFFILYDLKRKSMNKENRKKVPTDKSDGRFE